MNDDRHILASGCTSEAIVFFGCTTGELVTIVLISCALWAPILGFIGILLGKLLICIGFLLVFVGLTAVTAGKMLQGWKRGRPEGYYQQNTLLRLSKYGLVRNNFITHDGEFTLGRTHKVVRLKDAA